MPAHVPAPAGDRCTLTLATPEPPSVALALTVTVCRSGVPGSVMPAVGAVLSTRRFVTAEEVTVAPRLFWAIARKSKSPSETLVVSNEQEYGLVVSVQTSVQVPAPAGDRWILTDETEDPSSPSPAFACSVTVPRRYWPGSIIVAVRLKAFEAPNELPGLAPAAVKTAPENVTPAAIRAATARKLARARSATSATAMRSAGRATTSIRTFRMERAASA